MRAVTANRLNRKGTHRRTTHSSEYLNGAPITVTVTTADGSMSDAQVTMPGPIRHMVAKRLRAAGWLGSGRARRGKCRTRPARSAARRRGGSWGELVFSTV